MSEQPVVQIQDGKWYLAAFGKKPFLEECCDCGLVHETRFKFENGRIWVQYNRDEKRTKKARKREKHPLLKQR